MKNIHRGFVGPLLLIIIAVLLIGGGAYIYTQKNQVIQPVNVGSVTNTTPTTGTTNVLPADSSRSWCHTFMSNLKKDDGGSEVSFLDIALQKEKVGTPHSFEGQKPTLISDDGRFIADTTSAVTEFQAKYGLSRTGVVDSATRAKLNSLYGCANAITNQPSITVISPNGGEQWKIGSTQTIRWSYNKLSSADAGHVIVGIELWGVDNNKDYFLKNDGDYTNLVVRTNDTSSYTLKIPTHPLGPNGGIINSQVIEPGTYQIYIQGQYPAGEEKVNSISGKSNPFTIKN